MYRMVSVADVHALDVSPHGPPATVSAQRGPKGVLQEQGACAYLDARLAIPDTMELNAMLLPTRTSIIAESAVPVANCSELGHTFCDWRTERNNVTYLADAGGCAVGQGGCVSVRCTIALPAPCPVAEMFTLLIDHSFTVQTAGVARASMEMEGVLLDRNAQPVDPCEAYRQPRFRGMPCPSFIGVGNRSTGFNDIIAIRTLLNAAGIETLDEMAGRTPALAVETRRHAGVVLVLNIVYTNFLLAGQGVPAGTGRMVREGRGEGGRLCQRGTRALPLLLLLLLLLLQDHDVIKYFYQVEAIAEQEYKSEAVSAGARVDPSAPCTPTHSRGRSTRRAGS